MRQVPCHVPPRPCRDILYIVDRRFVDCGACSDMGHGGAGTVSRGLLGVGVLPRSQRGLAGVRRGLRGVLRAGAFVRQCCIQGPDALVKIPGSSLVATV